MRSASAMRTLTLPLESSDNWFIIYLPRYNMFVSRYEAVLELQGLLVLLLRFKSGTGTNRKPGFSPIRPKSLCPHGPRVSHYPLAGRLSRLKVSSPFHAQCIMHCHIYE